MAITEETRFRLHQRLKQALGEEEATTLMEHLPPVGWADVATKQDIANLAAATKRDIADLAAATKQDIADLAAATKRDIADLRKDMAQLAAATKKDLEVLGAQLQLAIAEVQVDFHKTLRLHLGTTLTVIIAAVLTVLFR